MLVDLNEFFTILLYLLLITLIIIFTVLGIKLIRTIKRVDNVLDDVNEKMEKVDGVFNVVDKATDYAALISDKIIGAVSGFIGSFMKKKKGNDEDE